MIKPLRNYVAIKANPDMEKSDIILFSKPVRSNLGTVIAVGSGLYDKNNVLVETGLTIGDRVLFDITQTDRRVVDGEEIYFTLSSTIVGVLKTDVDKV